jgi:hypothetical protein
MNPNGTVTKLFKHAAKQVMNDPAKCGNLIASVLATSTATNQAEPPLASATPSRKGVDPDFLASLGRQFAAQRLEATRPRE